MCVCVCACFCIAVPRRPDFGGLDSKDHYGIECACMCSNCYCMVLLCGSVYDLAFSQYARVSEDQLNKKIHTKMKIGSFLPLGHYKSLFLSSVEHKDFFCMQTWTGAFTNGP